jgi:hypothetical protein
MTDEDGSERDRYGGPTGRRLGETGPVRFLGRRRRRLGTTEDERLVTAAILESCNDPRSERLYQQFARSILPLRGSTASGLTIKPGGTTEDLLVPLDDDVSSSWIRCHDVATGQPLEFRVNLHRAGFFSSLEGRPVEGVWPREWHVDPSALREAATGALRLPDGVGDRCLAKLMAWLKFEGAAPDRVTCHKPARKADIDALVAQEGAPLPAQFPAFLRITDGLEIGALAILGCRDLYMVDINDQRNWLVAVEDDAHFIMVAGESPVVVLPSHDARATDIIEVGGSFPDWLRSRLAET